MGERAAAPICTYVFVNSFQKSKLSLDLTPFIQEEIQMKYEWI